jgi:DnaJ-class molecular chaperone
LKDTVKYSAANPFGVGGMPGMHPMGGFGMPGMPGGGIPFEFNMNDLFGNMFGNPPVGRGGPVRKGRKPAPVIQNINITLEQFYI